MRTEIIQQLLSEYEQLRLDNWQEELRRRAEVTEKIPEIAQLMQERQNLLSAGVLGMLGGQSAPEDAEKRMKVLSGRILSLLRQGGYPENYLDPIYRCAVCRDTGYTGEPIGYELFISSEEVEWLWNRLLELGAKPTGLGARDTLRLEAGLPLYGHEMGEDAAGAQMPVFAVSLAKFAVSFAENKGSFVGRQALEAQKGHVEKKVVAITLTDRGVMRAGMDIYRDGVHIGWVTSGTMVPYYHFDGDTLLETTGKRSIGFAYIAADAAIGDVVQIDVRGKRLNAQVVSRHMRQDLPPYGRAILA